jgi:hypothetical protein
LSLVAWQTSEASAIGKIPKFLTVSDFRIMRWPARNEKADQLRPIAGQAPAPDSAGTGLDLFSPRNHFRTVFNRPHVVAGEENIALGSRIRDVEQGPDGAIYLLTDHPDGQVLRLRPQQ